MGQEIAREEELVLLLGKKSAPERLARRGLSSREFKLTMSRKGIANYLGITLETVS